MIFWKLSVLVALFAVVAFCEEENVCQSQDGCKEKATKLKSAKEVWESVKEDFDRIKEACGELCDTTIKGTPGKYYDFIRKEFDCRYEHHCSIAIWGYFIVFSHIL